MSNNIKEEKPIPWCLEQPFVVFHAITENLYNSRELIGKVVSWPTEYNDEIIFFEISLISSLKIFLMF